METLLFSILCGEKPFIFSHPVSILDECHTFKCTRTYRSEKVDDVSFYEHIHVVYKSKLVDRSKKNREFEKKYRAASPLFL